MSRLTTTRYERPAAAGGIAVWRAGSITCGLALLIAALIATSNRSAGAEPQARKLQPADVAASATAGPSVDDANSPVAYQARNVIDGKESTAWRVPGDGIGETLTFRFDRQVHLSRIGVITGYAKIDPYSGVNRFWQNRRVLAATYIFDRGASVDVTLGDAPTIQWSSVDADTTSVLLRITKTTGPGSRNYTAISEVQFAGWAIVQPTQPTSASNATTTPQTIPASDSSPGDRALREMGSYGLVAGVVVGLAALAAATRSRWRRRPRSDVADPGDPRPAGPPTAPPPPNSAAPPGPADQRPPPAHWLKDRVVDNLGILLTSLAAFVATSVLGPLQRLGKWWLVVAALFAIGAVLAALSLLRSQAPPVRTRWLAGGLVACVGVTLAAGWAFRPDLVLHDSDATLLLLDTSQAMSARLSDGVVKLDAAKRRLRTTTNTIGVYEQLGLATYGVDDCLDRDPYHLRMPISAAGTSRVDRAVARLQVQGRSNNLAAAARKALGLLRPFSRLRRLVIFTATPDTCPDYHLDDAIRDATRLGVDVEWDIIGLGLEQPLPIQQTDKVRMRNIDTEAELAEVVRQILGVEPATRQFDRLKKYVEDQVRPEINAAVGAVNDRDTRGASAHLDSLTKLFEDGEKQFIKKPQHARIADCEAVTEFEREQFERLKEALPTLDDQVKFDREHPGELSEDLTKQRNAHVDVWNKKVDAYNDGLSELQTRVERCLNALSKPS